MTHRISLSCSPTWIYRELCTRPPAKSARRCCPTSRWFFSGTCAPSTPGIFSGKVWLHLRFVPPPPAQEQRILLAAQQVDIQVVSLLGLSGSQARLFGSLGLVVGGFLGLDGVLIWCFEQLAKRQKVEFETFRVSIIRKIVCHAKR